MGNSISPYCPPFFSRWKREGGTRRQGLLYSHATTIEAFHVHESTCVPFCVAFRVSSKKRSYLFSSFFCSLREKIRHFLSLITAAFSFLVSCLLSCLYGSYSILSFPSLSALLFFFPQIGAGSVST